MRSPFFILTYDCNRKNKPTGPPSFQTKSSQTSKLMEIRKNLPRKHLDATSATRQT
jgi:hypothetical protein